MSNSYRIRTTPGVNKNINVTIDQEFDFIEILSLKVLKDQLYTRQCSDYGVVIGRVSVNNGLGIPNAKVSVFIPLTEQDSANPIISEIYPYKTTSAQNEDGYRYNLLPYSPAYDGHNATGTFFDRDDVLTNTTLIEVFDKYYKFTTTTNDSGDYMLFGVPVGAQTLVVDIDLSDIGEFSLTPNDLIKMGVANESMVDGNQFKTSTNLDSLPQILSFTRNLEIDPLWGEPELCTVGITRTDFDVTRESNIRLEPTAIFMGSIFSDPDDVAVKSNCKVKKEMGNQCNLISSSGQIECVRQTINFDELNRPALEYFNLDNGGQVIDDDGTWLVDVPMNLDYVITNEFGAQVISTDPSVGVPTKGKYRFKIKWNQPPSLSISYRRGYYLVPNVREYGWTSNGSLNDTDSQLRSYTFSNDWNDYGSTGTTIGTEMINDAINCDDKFYIMSYNKIYTVAGLITEFRKGRNKKRFIGIKKVVDTNCTSPVVKFPVNDAFHDPDFLYTLYMIFMTIFLPVFLILLLVVHVLKIIVCTILGVIAAVFFVLGGILIFIGWIISIIPGVKKYGKKIENSGDSMITAAKSMLCACRDFGFKLTILSYPDCENCDVEAKVEKDCFKQDNAAADEIVAQNADVGTNGVLTKFMLDSSFTCVSEDYGQFISGDIETKAQPVYKTINGKEVLSTSLTVNNRLNLFNTKAKYFEDSPNNPGGGVNQIKVTFGSDINNPTTYSHLDNVICLIVDENYSSTFNVGNLITFVKPTLSTDPNLTGGTLNIYGNNAITGTTYGSTIPGLDNINQYTKTVYYADPVNGGNIQQNGGSYTLTAFTEDTTYAKYPIDIEYFQVIHATGVMDYLSLANTSSPNTLPTRFVNGENLIRVYDWSTILNNVCYESQETAKTSTCFTKFSAQTIVFLVRGVDPNTTKSKCRYDLSKLYGHSTFGSGPIVEDRFYLNIPIQGSFKNVKHDAISDSSSIDTYSNSYLFYESYQFLPDPTQFTGFSSGLLRYYSMVDNNNGSASSVTAMSGVNGLSIGNLNRFTSEHTDYVGTVGTCDVYQFEVTTLSKLRGYHPNEIVEGSSYLSVPLLVSNLNPNFPIISSIYSKVYPVMSKNIVLGSNNRQIVMRSDRLPSSSTIQSNGGNDFVLFENGNFVSFSLDSAGTVTTETFGTGLAANEYEDYEIQDDVLKSLQCENMVALGCYYVDPTTNKFKVKPSDDKCNKYTLTDSKIVENGAYTFVKIPLITYPEEAAMMIEWFARNTTTYGVCRGVFSFIFTNNWVNGGLYAFPFRANTFYDDENNPYTQQCDGLVKFDSRNNNFYYRSSPYSNNKTFVGDTAPSYDKYEGNERNLLFPTTMVDLGPKQKFLTQVSKTGQFDGYVMDKMKSTTFNDISDIMTLFVTARLVDGFSVKGVKAFFDSRRTNTGDKDNQKADGDLTQLLSINSELGVVPFEVGYYSDNDIYSYSEMKGPNVIGIFFSSDTQVRDYISPKRNILTGDAPTGNENCSFEDINIFTQEVPVYQWWIKAKDNKGIDTIFGQQTNNWVAKEVINGGFVKHKYQRLDRLETASRYMRTTNQSKTSYYKGYIYSVDPSGLPSENISYWNLNPGGNDQKRQITVGAPYHFYFGINEGKTAYDKFGQKWLDYNDIGF